MSQPLLLALIGLLYILVFGGLALLRQESVSGRFAIEALVVTAIVVLAAQLTGRTANPALFVLVMHLITHRVRLLVDVGTLLARRGERSTAARAFRLADRLWPDAAGRLIVRINQGVLSLHAGDLATAAATLQNVLDAASDGRLGSKHQAACQYNLGVAYQKQGLDAQATVAFNAVIDNWPATEFARYAGIALERRKRGG